jgi:hypothetical protein
MDKQYLVTVKVFANFTISEFETLAEAQEYIQNLCNTSGCVPQHISLSKKIPMKIKTTIEF